VTTGALHHRSAAACARWTMCSSSTGSAAEPSALCRTRQAKLHPSLARPVGELQMAHSFNHIPVLRDEVVALFEPVPAGLIVDATVGGGGHSAALLEAHPGLRVLGLDRDTTALEAAGQRLASFGDRVRLVYSPFSNVADVVPTAADGPVVGLLFDLGVSSPQLDVAERGFSFRADAALDMRMDQSVGPTAAELVNTLAERDLASLFRQNGEGRLAGRIAHALVGARPLVSTSQLAEVVASAVPAAVRRKGHPAKRVFQALRIEVNDELGQLATALPNALSLLTVGGRCAVISYHSGEDRLTKQVFADAATGGCTCPPELPCVCGARPEFELVYRGARKASAEEMARNRRSESARLRAIVRTLDAP
jgi:16S rRNA (cytosine1402-N4)-methyltransferase